MALFAPVVHPGCALAFISARLLAGFPSEFVGLHIRYASGERSCRSLLSYRPSVRVPRRAAGGSGVAQRTPGTFSWIYAAPCRGVSAIGARHRWNGEQCRKTCRDHASDDRHPGSQRARGVSLLPIDRRRVPHAGASFRVEASDAAVPRWRYSTRCRTCSSIPRSEYSPSESAGQSRPLGGRDGLREK